jgi:exodeoxyribonuclease V alpha subunit
MKTALINLKDKEIFNEVDFHFAKLLCDLSEKESSDTLLLSSILASNITLEGRHICIDLAKHAGQNLWEYLDDSDDDYKKELMKISLPESAATWKKDLLRTPVVGTAESQDKKKTPLVIDGNNRLYIYRYWDYERRLAEIIRAKAGVKELEDPARWGRMLAEYSKEQKKKNQKWKVDEWQTLAVFLALRNRFSVISGGPGTGKTTIASAVLSLILENADSEKKNIEIAVCAPTGKAAVRIKESLLENLSSRIKDPSKIIEPKTIHRLLGYIPESPYFRHNAKNPLPADVVVVDESSMVSLPLMCKLFKAVRPDAKLILLGDQHQLASVESGAILADICAAADTKTFSKELLAEFAKFADNSGKFGTAKTSHNMTDTAVSLEKSYRFHDTMGIAQISRLVNAGEAEQALTLLAKNKEEKGWDDITKIELPSKAELKNDFNNEFKKALDAVISKSTYVSFHKEANVADAYRKFNEFRILCSNRKGSYGIVNINRIVMEILFKSEGGIRDSGHSSNFKGCPIIITENDYALKLFNGDTGIIWDGEPDPAGGKPELRAYFPKPDLSGEFISFPLSRLPVHETAYAMTIHKAQGSGFKDILLILPDEHNPVLTRELVYTGITRAEKTVQMMIKNDVFTLAVESQIERSSGLRDLLKG